MHLKHIRVVTAGIPRSLGEGITLPEDFRFTDATPSPFAGGALQLLGGSLGGVDGGAPTPGGEAVQPSASSSDGMSTLSSGGINFSQITPSSSNGANGNNSLGGLFASPDGPDGANGNSGLINPLHGLGLTAEQYPAILQNILGLTSDMLDSMDFNPFLLQDTALGGPGDTVMSTFGGAPSAGAGAGGPGVGGGPAPSAIQAPQPSAGMGAPGSSAMGAPSMSNVVPRVASTSSLSGALKRTRDDDLQALAAKRSRFETVE